MAVDVAVGCFDAAGAGVGVDGTGTLVGAVVGSLVDAAGVGVGASVGAAGVGVSVGTAGTGVGASVPAAGVGAGATGSVEDGVTVTDKSISYIT